MGVKLILIADDDPIICQMLSEQLDGSGYALDVVRDGKSALKMAEKPYHAALLDLSLPGATGLDVLDRIKDLHPSTPVIIATAYASIQDAIRAFRQGAYDFIVKPFDLDAIQIMVESALDGTRLIGENHYLLRELKRRYHFDNIIGQNRDVQEAFLMAARVADTLASVLILGETGTGKEFLARAIHYQSSRAEGPFIKVNCAALPETLLESELFGHEKGAFTNAINRRIGRFEMADGGTLFLDEIGDISPATQVKLLRALQEKEFERVGGSETIRVNVRIVAATNRNLERAMEDGAFREDLFYRINVITIKLPPLRERQCDIPIFVRHFIEKYRQECSKPVLGITVEALELLQRQPWRGNIRELENCVERALILTPREQIRPQDFLPASNGSSPVGAPRPAPAVGLALREMERRYILATLEACSGNVSRAAQVLEIDRKTLRAKIRDQAAGDVEDSEGD